MVIAISCLNKRNCLRKYNHFSPSFVARPQTAAAQQQASALPGTLGGGTALTNPALIPHDTNVQPQVLVPQIPTAAPIGVVPQSLPSQPQVIDLQSALLQQAGAQLAQSAVQQQAASNLQQQAIAQIGSQQPVPSQIQAGQSGAQQQAAAQFQQHMLQSGFGLGSSDSSSTSASSGSGTLNTSWGSLSVMPQRPTF